MIVDEILYQLWKEYRDRMMEEQFDYAETNIPSDSMNMSSAGIAAATLVLATVQKWSGSGESQSILDSDDNR